MSAIKITQGSKLRRTAHGPQSAHSGPMQHTTRPPHLVGIRVDAMQPHAYANERAAFECLLARTSEPNVFAHPAWVAAMAGTVTKADRLHVLMCWGEFSDGSGQLLGVWCLSEQGNTPFAIRRLSARTSPFTELSTPVLDDTHADTTLAALLDHIETAPDLPKIIHCEALASDGTAAKALLPLLARTRRPAFIRAHYARNCLERADPAIRRDPLFQTPDVLDVQFGERMRYTSHHTDDLPEALEEFLALEAASWRGHRGTAIICDHASTALLRSALPALAMDGYAALSAIRLDGKAMRMGLALRCGNRAWLIRTALDEASTHLNPSRAYAAALNASLLTSRDIDRVDSCLAAGTGILAPTWTARQPMLDMVLDVRPQGSIGFDLLRAAHITSTWTRKLTGQLTGKA